MAGDGGDGGGTVTNALPDIPTVLQNLGPTLLLGTLDTIAGTIEDTNGEEDLRSVRIETTQGPDVASSRVLGEDDLQQDTKPDTFTDGWKVWDDEAGDGLLQFEFQYKYEEVGTYVWRAYVEDEEADEQSSPSLAVEVVNKIVVHGVVDADGTLLGDRWGGWSAAPKASNAAGTNWLKVENTGPSATQKVNIHFTDDVFRGLTNGDRTLPLRSNVAFACWEDKTPAETSPTETGHTYTFGSVSAEGMHTATFTGRGNFIYCTYRLASIPNPTLDQDYTAAYTVSPL